MYGFLVVFTVLIPFVAPSPQDYRSRSVIDVVKGIKNQTPTSGNCITKCPWFQIYKFLPHDDCNKYCVCFSKLRLVVECEKGAYFSAKHDMCVDPSESACGKTNGCLGQCPHESLNAYVSLAHQNCNKFCRCKKGRPVVEDCAPNYQFNLERQLCLPEENAGCDRLNGYTSTTTPSTPSTTLSPPTTTLPNSPSTTVQSTTTSSPSTTSIPPTSSASPTENPATTSSSLPTADPATSSPSTSADPAPTSNPSTSADPAPTSADPAPTSSSLLTADPATTSKPRPTAASATTSSSLPTVNPSTTPSSSVPAVLSSSTVENVQSSSEPSLSYNPQPSNAFISEFIAPETVKTPSDRSVPSCAGHCPPSDDPDSIVLLAHKDCTKYCRCKKGHPVVKSCPPNYYFSFEQEMCLSSNYVNCHHLANHSQ